MVQFRTATALIALVHADSYRKSLAFNNNENGNHKQRHEHETKNEVVTNLALNVEFHRAMMAGDGRAAGGIAADIIRRRRHSGRDVFAGIKKRRELRRKRDLSEAAAAAATTDGDKEVAPVIECVPEPPSTIEDADVGVISFSATNVDTSCAEGYMCIPSTESTKGGNCVASSPERNLQGQGVDYGYCPPGCPTGICECYDNYDLDVTDLPQKCQDLIVDTCRDGSYVGYCVEDTPELKAYYQGICDGYVCLADKGMFDINAENLCDLTDVECGDCYCTSYTSWCDSLGPLCDQGSSSSYCVETDGMSVVGVACEAAECCAESGGECFVEEGGGGEPGDGGAVDPGDGDGGGEGDPTDAGIAGAHVSRSVLLGALAVSAAAPTVLAALQ